MDGLDPTLLHRLCSVTLPVVATVAPAKRSRASRRRIAPSLSKARGCWSRMREIQLPDPASVDQAQSVTTGSRRALSLERGNYVGSRLPSELRHSSPSSRAVCGVRFPRHFYRLSVSSGFRTLGQRRWASRGILRTPPRSPYLSLSIRPNQTFSLQD